MKPENLKKLEDIARLGKDKALTGVRALAGKLLKVSGDMDAIHAKAKALTVSTDMQDRQVLEKWLVQQQEKLQKLTRLQAGLINDMKAAKTRAGFAVGRVEVIENIKDREFRARKKKNADRVR